MTHTTKHTPGPWTARKAPERNAYAWDVEGAQGTVPTIARMALVDRVSEVEANAHLVAAAPAMCEALRRIKELMDSRDIEGRDWVEYGQVTNALAQAEGKQ